MSEHKTIAEALVAFQAEAPTLRKDAVNPHFRSKFVSLDTIVETVQPLLAKHGLAWVALPCRDETGAPALEYRLIHATGELAGKMPLLLSKNDSQGLGSALTYARRYSICSVLNLVADEDDDGHKASQRQANGTTQTTAPAAQPGRMMKAADAAISSDMLRRLREGFKATGWDQPTLRMNLTAVGAQDVSDVGAAMHSLSERQASELWDAMAKAIQ